MNKSTDSKDDMYLVLEICTWDQTFCCFKNFISVHIKRYIPNDSLVFIDHRNIVACGHPIHCEQSPMGLTSSLRNDALVNTLAIIVV